MDEPSQTDPPPEQAVSLGEGGPAAAAAAWARLVLDDYNLEAAWPLMDRPLRLALVQSWLLNAYTGPLRDKDSLASVIEGGGHPLWAKFAAWRMQRWHADTFAFLLPGWGVVSIPKSAAPDIEFVGLTSGTGSHGVEAGKALIVQALTMRYVGQRWLLGGIGRTLAVPGWPPSEQTLPTINT
jgi:hypothetical protein